MIPRQMMISNKFKKMLKLLVLSILYILQIQYANGKVHHHKFVVSFFFFQFSFLSLINDGSNEQYL